MLAGDATRMVAGLWTARSRTAARCGSPATRAPVPQRPRAGAQPARRDDHTGHVGGLADIAVRSTTTDRSTSIPARPAPGRSGAETSSGGFTLAQAGTLNSLGGHRLSQAAASPGRGTLRLDGGDEFAGGIGAGGAYTPGTTLASGGMLDLGGGSGSTGRPHERRWRRRHPRRHTRRWRRRVAARQHHVRGRRLRDVLPGATADAVGTVRVNGEAVLGLDGDTTWSAGGWGIGRSGADTGIGGVVENRVVIGGSSATRSRATSASAAACNLTGATITRDPRRARPRSSCPLRNAGEIMVHTGLETIDVAERRRDRRSPAARRSAAARARRSRSQPARCVGAGR